MKVNTEFCIPNDPETPCRTTLMQRFEFGDLIWPNLDLYLEKGLFISYLLHSFGSLLAKFGFKLVNSPVSVAKKAKSDDFDLWPEHDLLAEHGSSPFMISFKIFD